MTLFMQATETIQSQAGKNNIFIIKNERDDQIYGDFYFDSSSSAARKNVVATSGNINLNYILNQNNRANDKVYTIEGDDTYQIGNLTNDTR